MSGNYNLPSGRLFEYSGLDLTELSFCNVRFDEDAGALVSESPAVVESPEIAANLFDQLIVSWNAHTPKGSSLNILAQARVDKTWSCWYNMGLWNTKSNLKPRTSYDGQDDNFASVQTDTLVLKKPADAFRIKIEMSSSNVMIRMLAIDVINSASAAPVSLPNKKAWGIELSVPEMSQLSVPEGRAWCSPTSVAMVFGYWSEKLNRHDLKIEITEAANAIHDEAWQGTGNWTFNTAYAGEFPRIRAVVTRFDSVSKIEECILAGVPVVVSLNYRRLNPSETTSGGHLMVIRGFTRDGDPIFNDPWTHMDRPDSVRKIFTRAALEDSWLGPNGSYGTVYLIHPYHTFLR